MHDIIESWEIERNGRKFQVDICVDDVQREPWKEECGHGPVSEWVSRDKYAGELVLCSDRGSRRYYDFAEAVRIARKEGWDTAPYGQGTAGQRAERAARADYERLRAWCNDEWTYVGVDVRPICPCCGESSDHYAHALWGVESDCRDYLETVAGELVAQHVAQQQES